MKDKIFEKNVLLKNYTTYKIGGPAEYFFVAKTKENLIEAVKTAKELKLPVFILAGGSNILVPDKGIKGLVIKLQICDIVLDENRVYAGAGMMLPKLVNLASNNGLGGLEWASGVPGTVGGAIYGHAQAFGARISDIVRSVEALDTKTLKVVKLSKKQCQFSLKNSIFKKNKNLIIVSALLEFKKANKKKINKKIKEYMRYRKTNHPINYPSAGSVFVNPESKGKVIPAGYLIEKAGLSGKKIGKAQISKKHANFIVNLGGAKAKDVLKLINLAKQKVKKTFGVDLTIEVQIL